MRLAILSALADQAGHAGASAGERPALRRFAGKSVLSHQIDCAALLGCERVICLTGGSGPDLGSARSYAERAGMRFETVDSLLRLASLVTADDDVIVIADGVLPDRAALLVALTDRPGVVAFPAEPALERGFERIDADRAWSGALRMRGSGVARLADLPPDCDLASSLLRIALQSGIRVVALGDAPLASGSWQRRVERQAGAEAERRWIMQQVRLAPFAAPGLAFAQRLALRWSQDAGVGRWARAPHLAAGVAGALAIVAGLSGWALAGLGLLLAASFALAVAEIFDRVETLGAPPRKGTDWLPAVHGLRDGLLAGLLALVIAADPGWLRAVLPIALIAVLRLGQMTARPATRALFGDRILLMAALLLTAWLGWLGAVVAALIVLALAELLSSARKRPTELTAD